MFPHLRRRLRPCFRGICLHLNERLEGGYFFELELLLNAAASGILDVVTFSEFQIFTYNQVANVVLIGTGLFLEDHTALLPVIISICSFIFSSVLLATLGTYVGSDKRAWLYFLTFLQATLVNITGVAYMNWGDMITAGEDFQYGVIVLLACVSGSQAVFARSVSVPDLWSRFDPFMRMGSVKLRSRSVCERFFSVMAFFAGTLLGAVLVFYFRTAASLIVSGVMRMLILVVIMAHPALRRFEGPTTRIELETDTRRYNIELHALD